MVPILSRSDGFLCPYAERGGWRRRSPGLRAPPRTKYRGGRRGTRRCPGPVVRAMQSRFIRAHKEPRQMKISLCASAVLLAVSTAALAQRPPVYPLRGQSAAAQSVDNAYCYWQARQQTGVDTTRQSQRPPRTKKAQFGPDAGKGASAPPLPAPHDASSGGSRAANTAAATPEAAHSGAAGNGAPPSATHSNGPPSASASVADSTSSAASPASGPLGPSSASAAAASPGLPPLPPPEPPMMAYWHAYSDCMQARGYGVQ